MNLEHAPARERGPGMYTVAEFCDTHRISRSRLYQLWRAGTGPRFTQLDGRRRITVEAAADWRASIEIDP
jgi:hypothetical protein